MKYKIARRKLLAYSVLPAIGIVGIIGANAAGAHGIFGGLMNASPEEVATRQQTMFEHEAQVLGISVDELKSAWAEGKSFREIMEEKGIDQAQVQARMKEAKLTQLKSHLQALVEKGVITQAQADKRLSVMQERIQSNDSPMFMGIGGIRKGGHPHMGMGL